MKNFHKCGEYLTHTISTTFHLGKLVAGLPGPFLQYDPASLAMTKVGGIPPNMDQSYSLSWQFGIGIKIFQPRTRLGSTYTKKREKKKKKRYSSLSLAAL